MLHRQDNSEVEERQRGMSGNMIFFIRFLFFRLFCYSSFIFIFFLSWIHLNLQSLGFK
ncbi:hypothetical protein Hdeb2414_s0026g00681711 [Helianthus debilis subsp. tardiflorus]